MSGRGDYRRITTNANGETICRSLRKCMKKSTAIYFHQKIVWAEGKIRAGRGVIWASGAPNDFLMNFKFAFHTLPNGCLLKAVDFCHEPS